MKLKETLILGKQTFQCVLDFHQRTSLAKEWEDAKLYQRRQELNQGKPHFTLHDGLRMQRKYPRWTCHEQDFKRYHCSF